MARRVKGVARVRSLLKRLPDAVAGEIRVQLHSTGRAQLAKAKSLVPTKTGALGAGLSYSVPPKRLNLKVGLIGKPTNKKLYYGRVVEFGRKAQTVIVTRGSVYAKNIGAIRQAGGRSGNYKAIAHRLGLSGTYALRVRGMAPRHFVYTTPRDQLFAPFRDIWTRALSKAAAGAGTDD